MWYFFNFEQVCTLEVQNVDLSKAMHDTAFTLDVDVRDGYCYLFRLCNWQEQKAIYQTSISPECW